MIYINYEDLDTSLRFIEEDFLAENRLLDKYELIQLEGLRNELEKDSSTDKKITAGRIEKLNSIMKIHEDKVKKIIEYLGRPFSNVPDYPTKKVDHDLEKFRVFYTNDYLLNYLFILHQIEEKEEELSLEEPNVFSDNFTYIINAFLESLSYISSNANISEMDYSKVFRIMDLDRTLKTMEA